MIDTEQWKANGIFISLNKSLFNNSASFSSTLSVPLIRWKSDNFFSLFFTSNRNEWSPRNDWGSFINIYWTYILFQLLLHIVTLSDVIRLSILRIGSSTMSRGKNDWMTDRVYMCESQREWMKLSFVHKIWCYCYYSVTHIWKRVSAACLAAKIY